MLEHFLATFFPADTITPVGKGDFGADVHQYVIGPYHQLCGLIVWESTRTKAWNNAWLEKLRSDQRAAGADIAVLVSGAMPKRADTFVLLEDVLVVLLHFVVPLATVLRMELIGISQTKQVVHGQQSKTEMIYEYLNGVGFRNRVNVLVEAFATVQSDLQKEQRAIRVQWEKRGRQWEKALIAITGIYGDLHSLAGQSLQEIEGLKRSAHEESIVPIRDDEVF